MKQMSFSYTKIRIFGILIWLLQESNDLSTPINSLWTWTINSTYIEQELRSPKLLPSVRVMKSFGTPKPVQNPFNPVQCRYATGILYDPIPTPFDPVQSRSTPFLPEPIALQYNSNQLQSTYYTIYMVEGTHCL